jgi:hypothetical protein
LWFQALQLALSAVLLLAGVAKLCDRDGTIGALRQFGAPPALLPILGTGLPVTEIAVGLALLMPATAEYAAGVSLALFAGFTLLVGLATLRGRSFQCHCFGQLGSASVGWRLLARDALLTAGASILVVRNRIDPAPLDTFPSTGSLRVALVLGVAVALESLALLVLLRRHGRLLVRFDQLVAERAGASTEFRSPHHGASAQVGRMAPTFALPDRNGTIWTLDALLALGRPIVLLFTAPRCGACSELVSEVQHWQEKYRERLTLVVVLVRSPDRAQDDLYRAVDRVLLQHDAQLSDSYSIRGTPTAVIVDCDGVVSRPPARGALEIRALIAAAGESSQLDPPAQQPGTRPATPLGDGPLPGEARPRPTPG